MSGVRFIFLFYFFLFVFYLSFFFLGFLNTNTDVNQKSPSNYGLMDQIAALHWLQENVAYFGGDPTNVTLLGHGTGAACVNFLMSSTAVPDGKLIKTSCLPALPLIIPSSSLLSLALLSSTSSSIPLTIFHFHHSFFHPLSELLYINSLTHIRIMRIIVCSLIMRYKYSFY